MTVRLVVACDSDPAPYAAGDSWPCRAWLPVSGVDPTGEALAAGWSYLMRAVGGPGRGPVFVHRCPACTRAVIARAAQRPQEAAP